MNPMAGVTLRIDEDGVSGVLTIPSRGTEQRILLDEFNLSVEHEQIDVTTFGSHVRSFMAGPSRTSVRIALQSLGERVMAGSLPSLQPVAPQPLSYRRAIDWAQE